MRLSIKNKHSSSFRKIIAGFALLILAGSFLLMLPISSQSGEWTRFSDSLFTATSATCVTGLIVVDTATYWSVFGQGVILLLIQIGGMGVITIGVLLAMLAGKKIGIAGRTTMQESISAPQVGGIVKTTGFIFRIVVAFELIGAAAMMPVFCSEFGVKGIWYSVFHSVSAYCNAGFDLMGIKGKFSSLTFFEENPVINITVMLLIIIGGLGFLVLDDIKTHKFRFKKYRMHSKVVLSTSLVLIVLPAVYFFFFEFGDGTFSTKQRIFASLFQAVSPRTAGFNTVDLDKMSESGKGVMMFLMLIGGSPGSTAGGMKTTTLAVLLASMLSVFKSNSNVECFKRTISIETVKNAAAVLCMYLTLFFVSGFIISRIDDLPLVTALFETSSAVGTVGLTLGVTASLSLASRLILIPLMFFGRVGGLTLIFAAVARKQSSTSKYPHEKIMVG